MKALMAALILSLPQISHSHIYNLAEPSIAESLQSEKVETSSSDAAAWRFFIEVIYTIKYEFYKDLDMQKCIPEVLRSGVSACTDRYSYYLDPVSAESENEEFLNGKFAGIGAGLEINKDGGVKVMFVYENSPAEKAGIKENDVIGAISNDQSNSPKNWKSIEKLPLDETVKLIRGEKGTKVHLNILRGKEVLVISIIRDVVAIVFLKSKMLSKKIGYVRINQFGGEVADQFYAALEKLESDGAESVILDLRSNPGGKFDSVLNMCAWLAKTESSNATILWVKDRNNPPKDITITNRLVGRFRKLKFVVLQNGNSASASEILSGYLKAETGAPVIGEKSYGKGVIQTIIPLSNKGSLHLTVAEYFIGRKLVKIHDIGVAPTVEVKNPDKVESEKDDLQLQKAVEEAEKLLK